MKNIFLFFLLVPSLTFEVSLVFGASASPPISVSQNSDDQSVLFVMTHKGIDYDWGADIPLGADPAVYIQTNADTYMTHIYRKMYRQAPKLLTLASWEVWIADGAKVAVCKGNPEVCEERVIPKKPFTGKHPAVVKFRERIGAANSIAEKVDIIEEFLGLK